MTKPEDRDTEATDLGVLRQEILVVIRDWIDNRGYPPTVREIGAAVGLGSPSSVAHHLKVLQRRGLLRRDAHGSRSLALPTQLRGGQVRSMAYVPVPLLGSIAAGNPILAEELAEEELQLPATLVGHGTLFALHVKGDSMIEAAICDGDIVVVRQQAVADNGDIVAAMIDGEATVKVYRACQGRVELIPRNPQYPAINAEHATILGKVVSVLRRL